MPSRNQENRPRTEEKLGFSELQGNYKKYPNNNHNELQYYTIFKTSSQTENNDFIFYNTCTYIFKISMFCECARKRCRSERSLCFACIIAIQSGKYILLVYFTLNPKL